MQAEPDDRRVRPPASIEIMWDELRRLQGPMPMSKGAWEAETVERVKMLALVSIAESLHMFGEAVGMYPVLEELIARSPKPYWRTPAHGETDTMTTETP